MPVKKPQEMNDDELYKHERLTKVAVYMSLVACIVMLAASILTTTRKGFNGLTVIPITMLPLFIINNNSLKEVRKEKQKRGLQ